MSASIRHVVQLLDMKKRKLTSFPQGSRYQMVLESQKKKDGVARGEKLDRLLREAPGASASHWQTRF